MFSVSSIAILGWRQERIENLLLSSMSLQRLSLCFVICWFAGLSLQHGDCGQSERPEPYVKLLNGPLLSLLGDACENVASKNLREV